jgi:hypothetical protein
MFETVGLIVCLSVCQHDSTLKHTGQIFMKFGIGRFYLMEAYSCICLKELKKTMKNLRITDIPAEIRTQHFYHSSRLDEKHEHVCTGSYYAFLVISTGHRL